MHIRTFFFGLAFAFFSGIFWNSSENIVFSQENSDPDLEEIEFEEEETSEETLGTEIEARDWQNRAKSKRLQIIEVLSNITLEDRKAKSVKDAMSLYEKGLSFEKEGASYYEKRNWYSATENYKSSIPQFSTALSILKGYATRKEATKVSPEIFDKAKNEFERLQKNPEKNHRKYKIALGYLKQYLSDPQYAETTAGEITFEMIQKGVEEKFIGEKEKFKTEEDLQLAIKNEYEKLANLFHDAQLNTVKELRHSIASGGILPGSRNTEGSAYVGETVIPKFINTLLVAALSVSTLLIMVAGGMYVFSYGDDELKGKGKNILKWTLIGTILMITAYAIVKFVININFDI